MHWTWEQLAGTLRHVLTFLGGFLVARGFITPELLPELVGAVITVGGLIWSFIRKTPVAVVKQAADIVPIPAVVQTKIGIAAPQTVPTNPPVK